MVKILFLIFSFISLAPLPALASYITIEKGDTLTKIAKENNTTIREIMDENNIYDANLLKEGTKLRLPANKNNYILHIVKEGDSLNKLSQDYNLDKSEIIAINDLNNPNEIFIGQNLKIPSDHLNSNKLNSKIGGHPNDNSLEKSNQVISSKMNIYKEDMQQKIDPNSISVNSQNESVVPDKWETYGPLKINWNSWKLKDGIFIANAIHESGKPLFIAVKCSNLVLNRTGVNATWRDWISPEKDFEYNLINKICKGEKL
tara:strand:- start:2374 stop:3150 length:777 start_codon:yes stop_codon:yes gene_type:complete